MTREVSCHGDNILISESVSSHMQILKRDKNFTAAGKIPVMVLTHQSTTALSLVRAWVRIGTADTAVHFLSLRGLLPRRQRQTRPSGRSRRKRQPAKINIKREGSMNTGRGVKRGRSDGKKVILKFSKLKYLKTCIETIMALLVQLQWSLKNNEDVTQNS